MSHDRFGRGTKDDPAQSGPSVRGNDYQIDVTFLCHANDFRRSLAMDDKLFNIEPGTLVTFGQFWEFALGGVFELFGDVGDGQGFGHPRVTDRGDNRLDHVNADDGGPKRTRQRGSIGESIVSTLAEIGG